MNYKEKDLPISSIELNKGQVAGLPKNPRFIRDERYKALVKSIKDAPEMLHLRELLVYQHSDKYVVIGGNMRLRACKELGMESVPCKILPQDTPVGKLREYTIKDNNGFGQDDWDLLANEWEAGELADWGLEIPAIKETEALSDIEYKGVYYEPDNIPDIRLCDCYDDDLFRKKIEALDEYNLTDDEKEMLRIFAYRFIRIDYELVATYYTYKAREEEKKAMERLRLVLTDSGLNGFVEDAILRAATVGKEVSDE